MFPSDTNTTPSDVIALKEETLRWLFSILGALLVYLIAATIVQNIYHPDIEALKNTAEQMLAESGIVRPEPMEALLFRLGVFIIIPSIACFYFLLSKIRIIKGLTNTLFYTVISVLCLALIATIVYFDFAALNPFGLGNGDTPQNGRDQIGSNNFDFYFSGLFLGNYLWPYMLVIVPMVVLVFFIGLKKYKWENKKAFKISVSAAGYVLVAYCVIALVTMNTYLIPYSHDNKYDFGAVYYSMTQVYAGTPMLVDHFTDTYGLYPQFLNPIFQLSGLNVLKFSLAMSLIGGVAFLFNFYVLKKFVHNKLILLLGFSTVFYFSYLNFKLTNNFDSLFAFFSVRYIIPSTLAFLTAIYLTKQSQKIYWITFFVSAFFMLWNPEMGLVCYLSWIAVNCYKDFYTTNGKVNKRKMIHHLVAGLAVLAITCFTYEVLIYAFYGRWPDLVSLFGTMLVFGKLGFGLLPMTLVNPWNLMAIILILGFTRSVIDLYKKKVSPLSSMVFLVSLIGLGFFLYYQGRSHNTNLALVTGFCFILLTMLGDELWKTVRVSNVLLLNGLFVIFIFFSSFSIIELGYNFGKTHDLLYQEEDKNTQAKEQQRIENNLGFIINNTQEHEKIHVFATRKHQALYFDGFKRVSAFNPGWIDLFLQSDVQRLKQTLIDSSFTIFMEPGMGKFGFLAPAFAACAATYEYSGGTIEMVQIKKRSVKIPAKILLSIADQSILHRKYADDAVGIKHRIDDALGFTMNPLTSEFSVQLLFYSKPQLLPNAMLISNINYEDSSGFAIGSVFNTENYSCNIGIYNYAAVVPVNQWVYYVANIYPDHLEVYVNGYLAFSQPLRTPMRPSHKNMRVGNTYIPNDFNYYIGAISEVAVNNKVMNKDQVWDQWRMIQQALY